MENSVNGYLKVRVTRAGGTLPVENAVVTITEYKNGAAEDDRILYSLRTDRGGLTETVSLAAPAFGTSTRPGNAQPFALYNVNVAYDGFYPVELVGVPVFGGVVAVQPVDLMPLGEADRVAGAQGDRVMIFEMTQSEALQPGGSDREDIGNENGQITGGVDNTRGEMGGTSDE